VRWSAIQDEPGSESKLSAESRQTPPTMPPSAAPSGTLPTRTLSSATMRAAPATRSSKSGLKTPSKPPPSKDKGGSGKR
jgi:hypothetical protein